MRYRTNVGTCTLCRRSFRSVDFALRAGESQTMADPAGILLDDMHLSPAPTDTGTAQVPQNRAVIALTSAVLVLLLQG